jgi:hypothetical protein
MLGHEGLVIPLVRLIATHKPAAAGSVGLDDPQFWMVRHDVLIRIRPPFLVGSADPVHPKLGKDIRCIMQCLGEIFDATVRWLDPVPVQIPPMVAYWPMDEGAGTVAADVVGGNNGILVGLDPNTAWLAEGGVRFDNLDGHHIEVPNSDALDFGDVDFSISMMVRYPVPPIDTDRWIIKGTHKAPGTGSRYELFQTAGPEVRWSIDNGPANIKTDLKVDNAAFITGEWVHVVVIRDAINDLMAIYANGILLGAITETSGDISNGEPLWIGESTDEQNTAMSADIDEVRIFDRVLTEDEIAGLY